MAFSRHLSLLILLAAAILGCQRAESVLQQNATTVTDTVSPFSGSNPVRSASRLARSYCHYYWKRGLI